jgi:endonuclease YncB( thermonuclease family)
MSSTTNNYRIQICIIAELFLIGIAQPISVNARETTSEQQKNPIACTQTIPPICTYQGATVKVKGFEEPLEFQRVIDGDTFIASGRKIRVWGIDAPEKDEAHHLAATMFLESTLQQGNLTCKFVEKDRYKRDVMHCFVDGLDVASALVQMGLAKDYKTYSGGYYRYEEHVAKEAGFGIWKVDSLKLEQRVCTQDTKQCPNGGYVVRTGPNCEFPPCGMVGTLQKP